MKPKRSFSKTLLRLAVLSLMLSALPLGIPGPVYAAGNPAAVQIYYVTLPEADALTVLKAINAAAVTPVTTYFSIAIGVSGTYVYYDQWENGYDSDLANPTNLYSSSNPGGTQVWGNGIAADGCAPNKNGVTLSCSDANDSLSAGDVILPSNAIPIPRNSNVILFDARDKVGASSSVAMARANWAAGSGTLNAFAHEMYATAEWGTVYESPVGTNTAYPAQGYSGQGMFEYSALSVMASQNATTVQIDKDANGSYETSVTLQEGGATLVTGISQGARVQTTDAAKPIQVVLVTGDIGSSYESRDMNLLPVSAYGSSYWSPVGVNTGVAYTPGPTRVFLYSPSTGGPTHITCKRRSPTATTVTQAVSARGIVTVDLNDNSGANCYASNSSGIADTSKIIFAIGTVDTAVSGVSAGQAGDWSFTLYPDGFLSTDALVGLGLGRDPTSSTNPTENGSPLWVTPACNTYLYVDWNNDGIADPVDFSGNGNTTETNIDGLNETTSASGFLVTQLKSVRLFKPSPRNDPYSQSGARVWSRTASGVGRGGTPGCNLALAWGQDPRRASAAAPGLDVGTSVPPLRLMEGTKSMELKTDADGDGVLSPGDTATTNITIKNTGSSTVNDVYVYDAGVPANTTYVANSTQKNVGSGWTSVPDDGSSTAFPLDVPGGVLLGNLAAGATFYVRFDVTLSNTGGVYEQVSNCDIAYTAGGNVTSCTTNLVASNEWGDLPDTYGTSLAANGPRHSPTNNDPALTLRLGSAFDRDLQGQPSTGADGDDLTYNDDEDGIVIAGSQPAWQSGGTGQIQVTVAGGDGCLNAWMDFTNDSGAAPPAADGNFTKAAGGYDSASTISEHIVQNVLVSAGTQTVNVTVPPGAIGAAGAYFRFRLSPRDGSNTCTTAIAPTGFVSGGEVEDYRIIPADLSVTKTDGATTVAPGSTIVYTLVIKNNGAATATGVTLADTLGANLSYVGSTCGTPAGSYPTYSWTLADLPAGESASCTVSVAVASPLADGVQLTNYAHVSTTALEVNITDNEVSDIDTVLNVAYPDLWVTKSDGNTQNLAGDTTVYTIQYGNVGTVGATNVSIVDVLPANVTYQSSSPAGTLVGSTLTWTIGNLAAGGSGSVQVTVQVNSNQLAGAIVLNHVSIDGAENDKNPADDSAIDSNAVIAPYVVTEKSVSGPDPVSDELTYAITWSNNSTATAANVQIQDTLPANTTLVAGSITGGGTLSGGVITWNLGSQAAGASGTVSFRVILGAGAGSATQTAPTLSTETGAGSVTLTSKTTAYSSLPWCDSAYNPKCLTYRGLYQFTNGVGPAGWNENPRATLFDDSSWTQPAAASTNEAYYWLPASTLNAEWTAVNTTGLASENYTFFRQAFCTPLNASNLTASLSLASDDKSTVYLNGISVGQHTGAGGYSTLDAGAGIQSGINILAVRLLNNSHGGHPFPTCPGCDHSGLLFNLQASYGSLRPFAYGPAMSLVGQSATLTVDENALGGRTPYGYKFDFGDGTVVDFQGGTSQSHTYTTPGTYVATVTARAAYGCTGSDQVVVQVLPAGSNLLANLATVSYQSTTGTSFSGQTGAGLPLIGAVGDRVWLDEDGDGIQDAGEAGIANVKVTLTNGVQTYITYTDANGNYVFANVPAGAYTVSIDPASMPSGLAANPTYDEDKTLDHTTPVDLKPGVEHMTADFGYNWASITDVTNPGAGATGAIGDRVWIDADGDGVQDAEELGLGGVTVTIYYDPDGNGVYDTVYPNARDGNGNLLPSGATTTGANGNYIFDDLPAGAYVVQVTLPGGYSQTGDPDQPGVTCTTCDNKTTAPVILAPGDVVVNADFGYLPNPGVGATIGGQLWLDTDANGVLGGSDSSLAGVTVALIEDSNGNGTWDPGEPVVATDITNAGGYYQFNGVPVGGNYLVWVNDAASVLPALSPTYDTNGAGTPNISAVASLTADGDPAQNFGYAPAAQAAGKGLIGDKIFLDLDGNGVYTPGEGLEGVTVRLYADSNGNGVYDTGEPALAQTTTNEMGTYTFGNLPAGNYVVVVDTATLPGGSSGGLTNTADPNGGAANQSGVSLAAGQINLGQDFGYQGTNTVSGTVWKDANADGTLTDGTGTTPDETGNGVAGVTLALYDAGGNLIATTITDASGNYSFANLPNGAYTVDVTDEANVLDGFWKSACPAASCGSDGYSQVDPYPVTLTGNQTNTTADFGYYRDPASLGNWVWYDANANGLQDTGETGIAGVVVRLTVTYPNGATTVVSTVTDASGYYSFANLLLDENYDVPDGDRPSYTISVVTPPPAYPIAADAGIGSDRAVDSGLASGETIDATRGSLNDTYDFGFSTTPTAVQLLSFSAAPRGDAVLITWETAQELNNLGFNLYRGASPAGPWTRLNATLIPSQAPGAVFGADYAWLDETVAPETTYFYRLEDVDTQGVSTFHGPVSITASPPAAVTLVAFGAGGNRLAGLSLLFALANLALGSWKKRHASL